MFDENLIWYMDCDYYKRCYDAFGAPKIVNDILTVNRVGPHQITNTLATNAVKESEFRYILKKYHEKNIWLKVLERKIKALLRRIK